MDKDQKGYLEDGITWTLMPDELVKMFIRRGAVREQNGDLAKMVYLDTRRVERAGKVTDFHGGYTSLISVRDEFGVPVNLVISDERQLWKVFEERDFAKRHPNDSEEPEEKYKFAHLKGVVSKAFIHDGDDVVVSPAYDAPIVMTNWCRLIGAYCLYLLAQRDQMGKIGFPYHSGLLSFFIRSMNLSTTTLREMPVHSRSVVAIDLMEALSILIEDARYTDFCGAFMGTVARFSKAFPELNELIIDEANKRQPKAVVDEDLDITAFVRRMMKLNTD
jgi:hypothetical protein